MSGSTGREQMIEDIPVVILKFLERMERQP
nr:MAG TPA: hypothetical protein [Caudoviricetes sp.]